MYSNVENVKNLSFADDGFLITYLYRELQNDIDNGTSETSQNSLRFIEFEEREIPTG